MYDAYFATQIPDVEQRQTILSVLKSRHLISQEGELLAITPRGREYIEWLDFTKALAAPIAAVVAALGTTLMVVRNYRAQRRLDRCTEWYQETQLLIGKLANAFQLAARAEFSGDVAASSKRREELYLICSQVGEQVTRGFLFAQPDDLDDLRELLSTLEKFLQRMEPEGLTPTLGASAAAECARVIVALSKGHRKVLGLRPLRIIDINEAAMQKLRLRLRDGPPLSNDKS
jgi:hypothetical protein